MAHRVDAAVHRMQSPTPNPVRHPASSHPETPKLTAIDDRVLPDSDRHNPPIQHV
jgi:hypothetical protein